MPTLSIHLSHKSRLVLKEYMASYASVNQDLRFTDRKTLMMKSWEKAIMVQEDSTIKKIRQGKVSQYVSVLLLEKSQSISFNVNVVMCLTVPTY